MYHNFSRWPHPAVRKARGWPTDRAVMEATRSGTRAAVVQEIAAPQSWPTRWTRGDGQVVEHADHVSSGVASSDPSDWKARAMS